MPVSQLFFTTTDLTDAQVKALPTTLQPLVPAPGAGKALVPIFAHLQCDAAVDYSNISATCVLELNNGFAVGILDEAIGSSVTGLLAPGDPADPTNALIALNQRQRGTTLLNGISGIYNSDIENVALSLECLNADGDFTGGDNANVLRVTIFYTVIDV